MTDNPYQSPQSEPEDDTTADPKPPEPRKNAAFAIAVGWNIPIVANFWMLFSGRISERTSNLLMAGWAATIPLFVLMFAYSPILQRWLLTGPIAKSRRAAAWVLAGFWAILSGWWLFSNFIGG